MDMLTVILVFILQKIFYRMIRNLVFSTGINKLYGEIDSGIWAVSYLLSMYKRKSDDFILFQDTKVSVNGNSVPIEEFLEYSCYMDKSYPLFSTKKNIKDIIADSISKNKLNYSPNDIRDMFSIDEERFERPFSGVGNEIFKMMSAVGYVYGKQVFCFPWMSQKRFSSYHLHLTHSLEILTQLKKIIILPLNKEV